MLYDASAASETVLKKATDTRNYIFLSLSGDRVTIMENSVKSVKDWSKEKKIVEREISAPVPAAG